MTSGADRLPSVLRIREHQRRWLDDVRSEAARGHPFLVCTSDEAEEMANALGIPVLVINYWNFVISAGGRAAALTEALHRHGYPGPHFFGLGLAASLHPELAPWGGLPTPTLVVGSTRNESELRVTELWARALGCDCYPLDFNFSSPERRVPPDNWWELIRDHGEDLVDPDRLALRLDQNRHFLAELEARTGRALTPDALAETMDLVNRQMDVMTRAADLIASAPRSPVSLRDQIAAYQSTWHRGTPTGLALAQDYLADVEARVADGVGAYPRERRRLLFWSMTGEPRFHAQLREAHDAVLVGSPYAAMPATYARTVHGDPLRALTARQLFLFDMRSTSWMIAQARRHRADGVIAVERPSPHPSRFARACAAEGIPFLALPNEHDDQDNQHALADFVAAL
ncbi:2-hydroxyacyl-CoA dehydratase [Pseudonocardia sp. DLS-67]